MTELRIDVWSDIACPWCYVGKRRLEAALEQSGRQREVEVVWRAFELDPAALHEAGETSYSKRLARKYRTSVSEARAMIQRMVDVARSEGLAFDFDRIRPGNTFDAHRLIHLAREHGLQDRTKERLLRAYLEEGQAIADRENLQRLAEEAGLDRGAARATLQGDAFADAVRTDEEEARSLGIHGVPFFVVGGRYAVSGAQPAELLLQAIEQAFRELGPKESFSLSEGAVCGPEGCRDAGSFG